MKNTPLDKSRLLRLTARMGSVFLPLMGSEQTVLLLLGSLVGVLLAFGALAFGAFVDLVSRLFFNSDHGRLSLHPREEILDWILSAPLWWIVLAPAIGGLLCGPLVRRFASEAKGHGIPEVIESVALRGGRIRKRVAVVKVIASALTIGSGGSAGREGPVVQIGSAIASGLSQLFGFKAERTKTLVACGAAAGIAATFNAPIAGVVFSLEIITGSFGLASFTPVVASAVLATVTTHFVRGNVVAFQIPDELQKATALTNPLEVVPCALLGLIIGLTSVAYIRMLYGTEDRFDKLRVPAWSKAALGGLGVGIVGVFVPRILGQGYETILGTLGAEPMGLLERAGFSLDSTSPVAQMSLALLLLGIAKMVATSLTIGSGGSGGVFAPALFIGATFGAAYGMLLHSIFPESTSIPAAYALIGMGAMVAGVTHAPISAVLILFEMTDDYDVVLPLMLASVIATAVCSNWVGDSIYSLKLRRKGINLHEGRDRSLLQQLRVEGAMQPVELSIHENTPFRRVVRMVTGSSAHIFPVVDDAGRLQGILTFDDLRESLMVQELADLVIAKELSREFTIRLSPDDTLLSAYRQFEESGLAELIVVDRKDPQKILGVLARSAAMDTYNRALRSLENSPAHAS